MGLERERWGRGVREHEAKPPSTEKHCIRIMSMKRRKSRALSLVEIKEDHPSKNKQAYLFTGCYSKGVSHHYL